MTGHVLQSEIAHPVAQAAQVFGHHILGDHAAAWPNDRRQPDDVIAASRADVGDRHPRPDAEQAHELAWLAGVVALLFVMPDRADDVRNRAIGLGKRGGRRARLRHEVLRGDCHGERGGKTYGNRRSRENAHQRSFPRNSGSFEVEARCRAPCDLSLLDSLGPRCPAKKGTANPAGEEAYDLECRIARVFRDRRRKARWTARCVGRGNLAET